MPTKQELIQDMCRLDARKKIFGIGIQQSWSALFLLNKIISENPTITKIVELGTLVGGSSLLFGMMMRERDGHVITFDNKFEPKPDIMAGFDAFNVTFYKQDIWKPECMEIVKEFIKDERALIFCDNGKKAEEFPLFAKILKPDDIIMAHDWGTEIFLKDLDDETLSSLELFHQTSFNMLTTRILSMKKCADVDPKRIAINKKNIHSR